MEILDSPLSLNLTAVQIKFYNNALNSGARLVELLNSIQIGGMVKWVLHGKIRYKEPIRTSMERPVDGLFASSITWGQRLRYDPTRTIQAMSKSSGWGDWGS